MTKTFSTRDIVDVISYMNAADQNRFKELPTKIRWNLKKNLEKFIPIAKRFEEFRTDLITELQQEWFTEDKTEESTRVVKDADGNSILNDDGSERTEVIKKIKSEYMEDFDKAVEDINKKLGEILAEEVELDISPIDVDGYVETMDENSLVTFDDLNVLSIFSEGE